jgi:hypothetical protein
MKKFLIATLSLIVGTTGLIGLLQPTPAQLAERNLSEVRYNLFQGSTANLNATLMSGEREDPYALDGVNEPLVDFGVITVSFLTDISGLMGVPTYKLTVDDKYYEGTLEKDPFRKNYVADVGVIIPDTSQVYLLVEWDSLYETLKLEPISTNWQVDWQKALDIAVNQIGEKRFNSLVEQGKLKAEVQVQIIADVQGIIEDYYWYVNMYGQNGSIFTVVIDPNSGGIVTERIIEY